MAEYIKAARKFYLEATREFEQGKKEGNGTAIRDTAEKAWGAVVQATNELIVKHDLPTPQSHLDRRSGLRELERQYPEIKSLGFKDRFGAREQYLHASCFYEGGCPLDDLEEEIFDKVKRYLDDIEALC